MATDYSVQGLIKSGSNESGLGTDKKKIARWVMLGIIGLGVAALLKYFILPLFIGVVWELAELLIVGIPTVMFACFVLYFWKHFISWLDILSDKMLGAEINAAPFRMQERKIELAEKNYERSLKDSGVINGELDKVKVIYKKQDDAYQEAREGLKRTDLSEEERNQLKLDEGRAFNYASILAPTKKNLEDLSFTLNKAIKRTKSQIANLKIDLEQSKEVFDVVMASQSAMEHMRLAMVGDRQTNSESEKAVMMLMRRISLAVGQTQASAEIVSEITRSGNLKDANKLSVAMKQLDAIDAASLDNIPVAQNQLQYNTYATNISKEFPI